MQSQLDKLIGKVRENQGPFFLARVSLRLSFVPGKAPASLSEEAKQVAEFTAACKELGCDPASLPGEHAR
jgi:hypothetical protein